MCLKQLKHSYTRHIFVIFMLFHFLAAKIRKKKWPYTCEGVGILEDPTQPE